MSFNNNYCPSCLEHYTEEPVISVVDGTTAICPACDVLEHEDY